MSSPEPGGLDAAFELAVDGPAAPPRLNGEVVFDAPWQSRAFGLAAALAESGRVEWPDLQAALIAEVSSADSCGEDTGDPAIYWRCWLDALGSLVAGRGLVESNAVDARRDQLAARPAGHDHR